jgi:hypothetical protein
MALLLSDFDEFTETLAELPSRRDPELLRDEVAALSKRYDELWRQQFLPEGTPNRNGSGPDASIDEIGHRIIRLGRLLLDTYQHLAPRLGEQFLEPLRRRTQSIIKQAETHWPFRDEAQISASREYFEAGGRGLTAKELLDGLRG